MKILFSLILMAALPAFAQEGQSTLAAQPAFSNFWSHVVLQAQVIGRTGGDSGSSYEVNAGYLFTERLRLDVGYGRTESNAKKSGGDLAEWEYVEKTTKLTGDDPVIDLRYTYWISDSAKHSLYVTSGAGIMKAKVSYDYNRYKPYNGFFCLFACPDKTVEESDSGTANLTTNFARAGLGYEWMIGRDQKISAYSLNFGVNYFKVLNPQSFTVGNSQKGSVGTELLGDVSAHVALSLKL